jgi:hypothetical protein
MLGSAQGPFTFAPRPFIQMQEPIRMQGFIQNRQPLMFSPLAQDLHLDVPSPAASSSPATTAFDQAVREALEKKRVRVRERNAARRRSRANATTRMCTGAVPAASSSSTRNRKAPVLRQAIPRTHTVSLFALASETFNRDLFSRETREWKFSVMQEAPSTALDACHDPEAERGVRYDERAQHASRLEDRRNGPPADPRPAIEAVAKTTRSMVDTISRLHAVYSIVLPAVSNPWIRVECAWAMARAVPMTRRAAALVAARACRDELGEEGAYTTETFVRIAEIQTMLLAHLDTEAVLSVYPEYVPCVVPCWVVDAICERGDVSTLSWICWTVRQTKSFWARSVVGETTPPAPEADPDVDVDDERRMKTDRKGDVRAGRIRCPGLVYIFDRCTVSRHAKLFEWAVAEIAVPHGTMRTVVSLSAGECSLEIFERNATALRVGDPDEDNVVGAANILLLAFKSACLWRNERVAVGCAQRIVEMHETVAISKHMCCIDLAIRASLNTAAMVLCRRKDYAEDPRRCAYAALSAASCGNDTMLAWALSDDGLELGVGIGLNRIAVISLFSTALLSRRPATADLLSSLELSRDVAQSIDFRSVAISVLKMAFESDNVATADWIHGRYVLTPIEAAAAIESTTLKTKARGMSKRASVAAAWLGRIARS